MSFFIVNEDISKMEVDVIVNAANTGLKMGGGVCGAIFKAAGIDKLTAACDEIGEVETGGAVITDGFDLKAKFIIHTPGPIYDANNKDNSKKLLYNSYKNSLILARENNLRSIAFPLISAGIYSYPKKEAFNIARKAIGDFLKDNDMDVYLTIVDKELLDYLVTEEY